MRGYYITFHSVTYAQQAEALLRRKGISCTIRRTPRWMESQGCGYCIRLDYSQIGDAVTALQENQLSYRKVYVLGENGKMEALDL